MTNGSGGRAFRCRGKPLCQRGSELYGADDDRYVDRWPARIATPSTGCLGARVLQAAARREVTDF